MGLAWWSVHTGRARTLALSPAARDGDANLPVHFERPCRSWFFGDSDDPSKSKCGCFLVDNTLTMSVPDEHAGEVCAYTPTQIDRKDTNAAFKRAEALPASIVEG